MSYQILARKDDKEIINIIFKMLDIKEGDKLSLDLKDDTVFIRKFNYAIPLSCQSLKPEKIENRLSEALESMNQDELLSEQEVWEMLANKRS